MTPLRSSLVPLLFLASVASAQDWVPMVHDGFGSVSSAAVTAVVHFGDADYVGTMELDFASGGRLLRSTDGAHWAPATAAGFGNPDNIGVALGAVFEGSLYASTSNFTTGGELWRSQDGSNWTRVVADGFGDPQNVFLKPVVAIGAELFLTTNRFGAGAQVWRSTDGAAWQQVGSDGFGDPTVYSLDGPILFGGALYVGTSSDSSPGLVMKSLDGNAWNPVGVPGFGDPSTTSIRPTDVFANRLYAGASTSDGGPGQLWSSADGTAWTPLTLDGFGDPFGDSVQALGEHAGWLYATCGNFVHGAALLRSHDGVNFEPAAARQFGWPGNGTLTGVALVRGAWTATTFNFETGAQLWALQPPMPLGEPLCAGSSSADGGSVTLAASGAVQLSGAGFRLDAHGLPANADALVVYGVPGLALPFGGGTLCVGAPRHTISGPFVADALGDVACFVDYGEPYAAAITASGAGVAYQMWFHDSSTGATGTSDALRVVHRP